MALPNLTSITEIVEDTIKTVSGIQIPILIDLFGINYDIYRQGEKSTYSEAYGAMAATTDLEKISEARILTSVTNFNTTDGTSLFADEDPGYAYSKDDVRPGDIIKVIRQDDKKALYFQILEPETIGSSTSIIYKFKISNIELDI